MHCGRHAYCGWRVKNEYSVFSSETALAVCGWIRADTDIFTHLVARVHSKIIMASSVNCLWVLSDNVFSIGVWR